MKNTILPLLVLALVGAGCPLFPTAKPVVPSAPAIEQPAQPVVEPQKDAMEKPVEEMLPKPGEAMEPKVDEMKTEDAMKPVTSTYQPFTRAAYDAAKASGKPIFLFFYANWCPTCRVQDPRLLNVVPAHQGGVVGFRVNYNDTETDADEKALAKEFGVTYQHTGFFIGRDGAVAQKSIGTITDAKTTEYLDLISK